jgi:hypothetical protein
MLRRSALHMKRRSCASILRPRHAGCFWKGAKGSEVALRVKNGFDGGGTERANQLVLQVCDTDVEAQPLHVGASEVGAEAGPLQAAPEHFLLARVTETRQPRARPLGPNRVRKRPIACAPPIGTIEVPSPPRSRPRRAARVSSAIWSLIPSTSTIARESLTVASARLVACGPRQAAPRPAGAAARPCALCRPSRLPFGLPVKLDACAAETEP